MHAPSKFSISHSICTHQRIGQNFPRLHSRSFVGKFHRLACLRQQPLSAAISSRARAGKNLRFLKKFLGF